MNVSKYIREKLQDPFAPYDSYDNDSGKKIVTVHGTTVKDLMNALKKLPPDAKIGIGDDGEGTIFPAEQLYDVGPKLFVLK